MFRGCWLNDGQNKTVQEQVVSPKYSVPVGKADLTVFGLKSQRHGLFAVSTEPLFKNPSACIMFSERFVQLIQNV